MNTDTSARKTAPTSKIPGWLIVGAAVVLILGSATFCYTLRRIFVSVKEICAVAMERHQGDNVEALIALAGSQTASFRDRNRAIWALGQIGDKRALPLLEELDTDEKQKKPYDRSAYIVQYTVEKAINQINGGFMATRWMYRWLKTGEDTGPGNIDREEENRKPK